MRARANERSRIRLRFSVDFTVRLSPNSDKWVKIGKRMKFYTLGQSLDVHSKRCTRHTTQPFSLWFDSRAQKRIEAYANCAVDRIRRRKKWAENSTHFCRSKFFAITDYFKWLRWPNREPWLIHKYYLFPGKMNFRNASFLLRCVDWTLNSFIAPDIQTTLMRWLSSVQAPRTHRINIAVDFPEIFPNT